MESSSESENLACKIIFQSTGKTKTNKKWENDVM